MRGSDQVVGEAGLAGDLGAAVDAAARLADDASTAAVAASRGCASLAAARRFDRFEDLLIAGAAAEAAGERLADLVARRVGVLRRAAPWR